MIVNNNLQRIYGVNSSNAAYTKNQPVRKHGSSGKEKDVVALSSIARDYTLCKQALADVSDVREDKIAMLKARYETTGLNVSSSDIADKLLKDI